MKIAQQIRKLLADGKARTAREMYEELGTDPIKTAESASNQGLRGILVKDNSVYPGRYSLGRAIPDKLAKEELARRERDRKRQARLRNGCKPMEQVRREAAQKTAQRVLEAKVPKKPISIPIEPRRPTVIEAKREPVKVPCTDTWIRQNPDKVQRLPAGVWANPVLRFEY